MGFMDAFRGEAIAPTGGAKSGTIGGGTVDAITGLRSQSTNAQGLFATMRRNKIIEEELKQDSDLLKALKVSEAARDLHLANIFGSGKKEASAEQKRIGVAAGANAAIGMESAVSSIVRRKNEYHRKIFNIQKQQDAQAAVIAAASTIAEGISEHWPKEDPNVNKPIYTDDPSVVKFMRDLQKERTGGMHSPSVSDVRVGGDFAAGGRPVPTGTLPGTGPAADQWRETGLPADTEGEFIAQGERMAYDYANRARDVVSDVSPYSPRTTGGVEGLLKRKKDPAYGYGEGVDFSSLFLSDEPFLTREPYPSIGVYDQGGFWDPSR